jgi:hypothetical protein
MRLKRFYNPRPLNLKDIHAIRETFVGWFNDRDVSTYRLIYLNEVATFRTIGGVQQHIASHGLPQAFFHRRSNIAGREAIFDATNSSVISIEAYSVQKSPDRFINSIARSLGLVLHAPQPEPPDRTIATAFVGVPFTGVGKKYAAELIEFLKAADIDARTASEYQPQDFREKIFRLIDASNLVFVIAIPHDNLNFIISEATYAHSKEKPLFILEQCGTDFKPGLVGSDHQRAPFSEGHVSEAFTNVLQGIQHLKKRKS